MKVKDVMTQSAICCRDETNVGAAVELLWVRNCGILPVIAADGRIRGVVTDRDICIAMGTRDRRPGDVRVSEIMSNNVISCKANDDIHEALSTMAEKKVRRLPVLDNDGFPVGVLSMDDIITHGDLNKWQGCCELSSEEIVRALKKLYSSDLPMVHAASMAA
jgi:CBS domain-containing protein